MNKYSTIAGTYHCVKFFKHFWHIYTLIFKEIQWWTLNSPFILLFFKIYWQILYQPFPQAHLLIFGYFNCQSHCILNAIMTAIAVQNKYIIVIGGLTILQQPTSFTNNTTFG